MAPAATVGLFVLSLFAAGPARPEHLAEQPQILTAGEILRGSFVLERRLAGFEKPLRSQGRFSLIPGRGLIWHVEKPFESTTVIASGGISVKAGGQNVMRLSTSRMPGIGHLYEILENAVSGNAGALKEDFTVRRSSGADGWTLVLLPRQTPATTQIGRLVITGRRFVDRVEIERTGGDVDQLQFLDEEEQTGSPTAEEDALLAAQHR